MKLEILDLKKQLQSLNEVLVQKWETIHLMMKHLCNWDVKSHHKGTDDVYEVPMSTFWLPINLEENIETDYSKERFKKDFIDDVVNGKVKQEI